MSKSLRATKPFLHYGIIAFFYAIGIATLFSHTILHALGSHEMNSSPRIECTGTAARTHQISFTKDSVQPRALEVDRCDDVKVINNTNEKFTVAIGPHNHHINYPGFVETSIQDDKSYTFRASLSGSYMIHDHDDYELAARLVVK